MRYRNAAPAALVLLALSLTLSACPGPTDPASANRKAYPSYEQHFPELFDDAVEAAAVGVALEDQSSPRTDNLLRERTQVGDAVVRVVVTTVTRKKEDVGTSFQLDLRPIEKLTGTPPETTFSVRIPNNNPSIGILNSVDLTGKRFVAFVKTFVRSDGDTEIHFHLASDEPAMQKAVRDAAALQELK